MSHSDNTYTGDVRYDNGPVAPDSPSHLDKIRDEVRNTPNEPAKFHGLDIGILKIGVTDDGAFNPGFDIGIAHAQVKVGLVNGADAGVGLGPVVGAHAGAYVGVDRNGFKGNAGAGGHALGLVGARGEVNTRLGDATGAQVQGGAHVGPFGARVGAGAAAGDDGIDAVVGARAHAGRLLGAHAGGYLGLNDDSQVGAAVGGNLGDLRGSTAAGVWTNGNSTIRPDIYGRGRAGYDRGMVDLNPPVYGYERSYDSGYTPYSADRTAGRPCPPGEGNGKPAAIEVKPLPPVYEAATPENVKRVQTEILTKLCNDAKYTVVKGDTFQTIAAKLMPGADATHLAAEAQKLQKMHEENGYKTLKPGQKLATEDPYTIDREARQAVAKHFGWKVPTA